MSKEYPKVASASAFWVVWTRGVGKITSRPFKNRDKAIVLAGNLAMKYPRQKVFVLGPTDMLVAGGPTYTRLA